MSFVFTVVRDAEGIRLEEVPPSMLEHIPPGRFQMSGHVPNCEQSNIATLSVSQYPLEGWGVIAQISTSYASSTIEQKSDSEPEIQGAHT